MYPFVEAVLWDVQLLVLRARVRARVRACMCAGRRAGVCYRARVCECVHVCEPARVRTCVRARVRACPLKLLDLGDTDRNLARFLFIDMCIHIYVDNCIDMCIHMCVDKCIDMCIHMCVDK